jgi:hypothetical protein
LGGNYRVIQITDGNSCGWQLQLGHHGSLSSPKRSATARGTTCSIGMGRHKKIRAWDGISYGHCGLSSEEVSELQAGEEYL